MAHLCKLFIVAVQFAVLSYSIPIEEGEAVGRIESRSGPPVVSGHNLHPYVVYIKIISSFNGKQRDLQSCGGVIIGKRTILTAAHCLYEMDKAHVVVQAGIIDTMAEKGRGQNIIVKDRLIHELYQKRCRLNKRFCFNLHDVAILWLEFDLQLGPNVKIADLGQTQSKPFDSEGWILGWGLTKEKKLPSMLQRGRVKVMTEEECKAYNPYALIIDSVICLKPVQGKTRSSDGDSGGPFVINGVVYGISSSSVYDPVHLKDWRDLYTYVPLYVDWIRKNQKAGPPKSRKSTSSNNNSPKQKRRQ